MIRTIFAAAIGSACLISSAAAQPAQRERGGFGIPSVGTMLPDVAVFDDQGREFSTKVLREHHSVLVFGCLT